MDPLLNITDPFCSLVEIKQRKLPRHNISMARFHDERGMKYCLFVLLNLFALLSASLDFKRVKINKKQEGMLHFTLVVETSSHSSSKQITTCCKVVVER